MPQTRQLAVIMFTDIVGYTALMGKDEAKAFQWLEMNRQLQKPIITQHKGRWIKELGDGVMASFNTVSDAVNAALAIQQSANTRSEFQLRIGIHLGEVVFEDGDVFGDGVNIASRIQSIAYPGSIFVSESVHTNVSNKKDVITEFVQTATLKNVREPVKIYQVIAPGIVTAPAMTAGKRVKRPQRVGIMLLAIAVLLAGGYILFKSTKAAKNTVEANAVEKSIAVLPFVDMSPARDQEYLSDGLAEEIINSISIIRDLKVKGRTSSFQYKGKGLDAQEIGKKLNVNIVLEGSIQKSGDHLRIFAQLIRVKDNSTIWSQRFDKELKDIFAIQDSIAIKIVEKLKLTISESERPRLTKKETDPEVYSRYLKGLYTYKADSFQKSIEYNLQAIGLDSQFAPSYAYIALAKTWLIYGSNNLSDFYTIREAKEFANRAIQLDPDLAEGYSALGLLAWSMELDFAAAKQNFERSIALNPSASLIKNRYAYFLLWMGDFDKAEALGRDAINSDPADYNGYLIVSNASIHKKKFREAEKYIAEGKKLFPHAFGFARLSVYSTFYTGNYRQTVQSIKDLLVKTPNNVHEDLLSLLSVSYLKTGNLKESDNITRQLRDMLPGQSANSNICYALATIYAQSQMKDSCFQYLEKSLEKREKDFRYLKIDPLFDPVRKDPRFQQLLQRYGFDKYH